MSHENQSSVVKPSLLASLIHLKIRVEIANILCVILEALVEAMINRQKIIYAEKNKEECTAGKTWATPALNQKALQMVCGNRLPPCFPVQRRRRLLH